MISKFGFEINFIDFNSTQLENQAFEVMIDI